MDVTVAICTRNRAPLLSRTLENLRALDVPAGVEWELIVVNNGSSDDTASVLSHAHGLPLRALSEPSEGKAYAANRATEEARGALLVWTDDDTRPDAGWLRAYLDLPDDADFAGGPVQPWFEREPPEWLSQGIDEVALPYALIDLAEERRQLRDHEGLNGPNFALRTDIARNHHWSPSRGRHTGFTGDEAELIDRLKRDGCKGYWLPEARVEHWIPAGSMTLDYIAYRYRLHGEALMRQQPGLGRAIRSALAAGLEAYPRYVLGRGLNVPPRRWLRAFRRYQTHVGKLSGFFHSPADL